MPQYAGTRTFAFGYCIDLKVGLQKAPLPWISGLACIYKGEGPGLGTPSRNYPILIIFNWNFLFRQLTCLEEKDRLEEESRLALKEQAKKELEEWYKGHSEQVKQSKNYTLFLCHFFKFYLISAKQDADLKPGGFRIG
jgi:hypothetical protein